MGSNPEIQRIQAWVGTWYGEGECPYSMEDIRNICRGPMRQVLLDFLLPRFRTDDQIKVMRSNLFLNDVAQKDGASATPQTGGGGGGDHPPTNQFDQQINILKGKLNQIHVEKIETAQRLAKHMEKAVESKQTSQTSLMKLVTHYGNCESRAKLIRDRVSSTNILVRDLNNAKPNYPVHANGTTGIPLAMAPMSTSTPGSDNSPSPSNDSDPLLPQLRGLYSNASELFDLYFLPNPNTSGNISQYSSSPLLTPEIQELTTTVAMQTADIAHSGIPPTALEQWAKKEQDISAHKIRAISTKFSNVMNPLEELQNETDAIYTRLMYSQIGLHLGNRELNWKVNDLAAKNSNRIQDTILNQQDVIPADLLSLIKKEEQSKQLFKCRELARQLKQIECIAKNSDVDDVLALLCDDDSLNIHEGKKKDDGNGKIENSRKSLRASFGSMDGSGNVSFAKQETLEDISCALLKSIPHTNKQLETTIQQGKNLVLDRFPKILSKDDKRNTNITNDGGKLMGIPIELSKGGISSEDIKIKIPHQFIPNHDLLKDSPLEQHHDDLLSEVFTMQKELEAKKLQTEALLRERGSFVRREQ